MAAATDPNSTAASLPTIGWREWLELPDLGIPRIKAKVDTGAQTSSLHAVDVETFQRDNCAFVRFSTMPLQSHPDAVQCEARILELRHVRTSDGQSSERPVIATTVRLFGKSWLVEVTLADRTRMGFRMLLGRHALRDRFVVDAGQSFLGGTLKAARPLSGSEIQENPSWTD